IAWNANRQILGEVIEVFMKDSTIDKAHVINQALSVEQFPDGKHYNQLSSREMFGFFENGDIRKNEAIGNVIAIYYMEDDKDSSLVSMLYLETDTLRMFMQNRVLQSIWTCKQTSTMYPVTQVPPAKSKLASFAWFDYIRPLNKDDIFEWRGKKGGTELKTIKRLAAPVQYIKDGNVVSKEESSDDLDKTKPSEDENVQPKSPEQSSSKE
ncbi:MAG: hypothetical protein Q4D41_12580, partial [Prevotellaceae bacterium]|nr:hypothetical protein [Prevotellaceae bacterium]